MIVANRIVLIAAVALAPGATLGAQDHAAHAMHHAPPARPLGGAFVLRALNGDTLPALLPPASRLRVVEGALDLTLATPDSGRFEMRMRWASADGSEPASMRMPGTVRVRGDSLVLSPGDGALQEAEGFRYAWTADRSLELTDARGNVWRYSPGVADTAFRGVQARGKAVMGVDQYTSSHVFEPLPDGGRIVLQRDVPDAAGEETIRAHMDDIAGRFARGDFSLPGQVHGMAEVPGTRVMAAKRAVIRYEASPLPRGGQVRITTTDPEAVKAVHEFLAFQRMDHRAAGHDHR